MFRVIIVTILIGVSLSMPQQGIEKFKQDKKGKFVNYKFDGIIGGDQNNNNNKLAKAINTEYSEGAHVRNAPQDPHEPSEPVPNDHPNLKQSNNGNFKINYDELNKHQAESAHYSFDSSIQDNINDHQHIRQEQRDGLKVTGMYSYSDGFFQRTVHYIADEKGYRVVKEDVRKIGEGPQFNSAGQADVKGSLLNGGYTIQIDDEERNPHYVGINQPK